MLYFFIMNLVFIQVPLSGSLPGNLDTWANLAMFKDMGNHILNIFHQVPLATSNYPCKNIWPLFGLDFFSGIIFLFYKLFNLTDIWAYHFYITTIFALNSLGIYKLCSLFSKSKWGGFLAGIFFSISNFVLANIDNPNIVLIFPGLFAFYCLIRSVREDSIRDLYLSLSLFCVQLLLAPVTCVMLFFVCGPYMLLHFPKLFGLLKKNRIRPFPILICILSLSPYIYYYFILRIPTSEYNIVRKMDITTYMSMNLEDFIRPLPNNILIHSDPKEWSTLIKSGYTGIAFLFTALAGGLSFRKSRLPIFIFLVGFIFSMGPHISSDGHPLLVSPVMLLYKIFPVSDYLRIPARFFIIGIAGLSILFSIGWEKLSTYNNAPTKVLMALIVVLYVAENLPMPMKKYPSYKVFDNGIGTQQYIQKSNFKNVLNLPSRLFESTDQREYVYMYYQTINTKRTINGSLAYVPAERLRNDSLCKKADQDSVLKRLINNNGIDLVVFHSDMADISEECILRTLESSDILKAIDTSGVKKVFCVKNK